MAQHSLMITIGEDVIATCPGQSRNQRHPCIRSCQTCWKFPVIAPPAARSGLERGGPQPREENVALSDIFFVLQRCSVRLQYKYTH